MVRYICYRRRAMIRSFRTGTAAAQNHPVIRICSKCGALLLDDSGKCSFCDIPDAEVRNTTIFASPWASVRPFSTLKTIPVPT